MCSLSPPHSQTASRFRFSLETLLTAVTAVGGSLAAVRLQVQLLDSERAVNIAQSVVEVLPLGGSYGLLSAQAVAMVIAVMVLFLWRRDGLLWIFAAGHLLWLTMLATGWWMGEVDLSIWPWLMDAMICYFFFEPACALAIAGVALCQSLWQSRLSARSRTIAALIVVATLADVCAIVELHAFASAIAAGVMAR